MQLKLILLKVRIKYIDGVSPHICGSILTPAVAVFDYAELILRVEVIDQ